MSRLLGLVLAATLTGWLVTDTSVAADLPLADGQVHDDVVALIHELGQRFTDIDGPQPIGLFDRDDPAPQYLGEEMDDWMIGWEALEWYFGLPERFAAIQAMDYHPSNIRVRSLTPELALATWNVLAEMKFRRGAPLGEHLRANAVVRKTSAGWRFIYYAEAPKSTLAYIQDLYEATASEAFRSRFAPQDNLTTPPAPAESGQ